MQNLPAWENWPPTCYQPEVPKKLKNT
ncbi:MAG: cyclic lactone autoinducer peptide [Balneolia bacterium]|nr:cyclic lactone autoinducer peptide [Balneolia bacterium]